LRSKLQPNAYCFKISEGLDIFAASFHKKRCMKPFSLFILPCCLALAGCFSTYPVANKPALSKEYAAKYADKLEPGSILLEAWINYTVEKTADSKFIRKMYYPDNRQMTHFTTYSDRALQFQNGTTKEWWDDGSPVFEGQMSNNLAVGEWRNFFGSQTSTGNYANGKQEGLWVTTDSLGNKLGESSYVSGVLNGPFKHWNKEGQLWREGAYKEGKIDWEKTYEEDGTVSSVDLALSRTVEVKPSYPGCDNSLPKEEFYKCSETKMLQALYGTIKYPPLARENGIEGTAVVSFVVEKDGSISSINTKRGICREIKAECERVIGMMPNWNPGMQRGKPVRVLFNWPIKFKLE
jgi:protein TonB